MFVPLKIHIGDANELLFRHGASESLLCHEDGALVVALVYLQKETKENLVLSPVSVL